MALLDMLTGDDRKKTSSGMEEMDILDKLHKEHKEVKALLKQMVQSEKATERTQLLKKVKAALIPHTKAEEKVVYNAVLALKDKDAKIDGHEGYFEHAHADMALKKLGTITPASSPEFTAAAKVLKELIEHHVREEESNIWADVEDNFNEDERIEMNRQFEAAKKKVRLPQ